MDPRISRWAKTLVGYCLEVKPGESVQINATPAATPLIAEVYREVLRAGGHPVPAIHLPELTELLLREGNDEQLQWLNPADRLLVEQVDCILTIHSQTNTRLLAGIDPARQALAQRAQRELYRLRQNRPEDHKVRWCSTLYPTEAYAQDADMSLADFTEFVYDACFLNSDDPAARWKELGGRQQFYVDWLRDKQNVHVIGPDTDLRLSIAGRTFRNSDGKRNFPSGEFFTGPVEDSAQGHIRYTVPSSVNGRAVQDIRLRFENGRVVEAIAAQGQVFLDRMLDIDEGARYLGEFAFGNNFGIQRPTRSILFDEKMGGTIHLALGNSYPETGGKNVSALHWDMICDLRPEAGGGEVYVDDILVLKDGKLVLQPE
ncbi:MAG TPA: aminopeptidase [Ktedonobacterales bacterium]|nr:aminopeptidase [Ktedonobacterales bacterium]